MKKDSKMTYDSVLGTVPAGKKPKHGEFRGRCFEDCAYKDCNNKCTNNNRMVNIIGMCLSWK